MVKTTPLYNSHLAMHAKMMDFHGWMMPLNYGSQIDEHHKVRQSAGMFDVSHMMIVDITGKDTKTFLLRLVANDVNRLTTPGKALYTCMLNEAGGVIDDLIIYWRGGVDYRLVLNAGTREKDMAWLQKQVKNYQVNIKERSELAMIAVQGPEARSKILPFLPKKAADIERFASCEEGDWFIARTGYTGEDGFEVMLPATEAPKFWQILFEQNVAPCGLGARDTLRLEAGMSLYGNDMDESVTPLVSNLEWTISWEHSFIGKEALLKQKEAGIKEKLVGLILTGKGVLRPHQKVVVDGVGEGVITSGTFSPTLKQGIALARVPANIGTSCTVAIRDKLEPAKVVKTPFVKKR